MTREEKIAYLRGLAKDEQEWAERKYLIAEALKGMNDEEEESQRGHGDRATMKAQAYLDHAMRLACEEGEYLRRAVCGEEVQGD